MPAAVQRLYVPGLQWKYPEGIIGTRPEIVRQYRSASMAKMQRSAETTGPLALNGREVTECLQWDFAGFAGQ